MSDALSVRRGDTYRRSLTIYGADGEVYDLSDATVWFTVKDANDRSSDDDDALVKLYWVSGGASSGITVDDPETGVIVVEMTPAQTNGLTVGRSYRYDVQVLNASKIDTPLADVLTVDWDVTRRATTP